jgi:hypothetical protein
MSDTVAPWDAELQGWRVARDPVSVARPPRLRQVRTRSLLWHRLPGSGETGARAPVPWDALRQRWVNDDSGAAETSGPPAHSHRLGVVFQRAMAVPLCALAVSVTLAVLGDWWAGVVFLVWSALVVRGVRTVRRTVAEAQAARPEPTPSSPGLSPRPGPVSPGRAFAEGIAQVLMFPALFTPNSGLPASESCGRTGAGGRTGSGSSVPEPSRERSRRDVGEALSRAHAELGLALSGEPGVPERGSDTGGTP